MVHIIPAAAAGHCRVHVYPKVTVHFHLCLCSRAGTLVIAAPSCAT